MRKLRHLVLVLFGTVAITVATAVTSPAVGVADDAGSVVAVRYIIAVHSGKCVTVNGWSTSNGGKIDQWTCLGQQNQRWNIIAHGVGRYLVKSESSNKCLDGGDLSQGRKVIQWSCHGNANQSWNIDSNGSFHVGTRCLDVEGKATGNGAGLILWTCNGQPNQRFR